MKEKWNKPLLIIISMAGVDVITSSKDKDENIGEWD